DAPIRPDLPGLRITRPALYPADPVKRFVCLRTVRKRRLDRTAISCCEARILRAVFPEPVIIDIGGFGQDPAAAGADREQRGAGRVKDAGNTASQSRPKRFVLSGLIGEPDELQHRLEMFDRTGHQASTVDKFCPAPRRAGTSMFKE